jgi:subtilase family protein
MARPAQGFCPHVRSRLEVAINRCRLLALSITLALPFLLSSGAAARDPRAALIADAGDSAFVQAGEAVSLGGMAWGGASPYRFAWSFGGATSRFTRPTSEGTIFKTDGLKAGDHTVTLKVTDSDGAVARDTVRFRVYSVTATKTILHKSGSVVYGAPDETVVDPGTGSPDGSTQEYPFTLASGIRAIDLTLKWADPVNDATGLASAQDIDFYLSGPDPKYLTNSGGASIANPEHLHFDAPKPGAYKVIVAPYLSGPTDFDLTVTAPGAPPVDPLPKIDVPATVRFVSGQNQTLKASGTNASSVAWDLDFNGTFERRGANVNTNFVRGTHLATLKATKNGFEARRTVAVTVVNPDEISATTSPFVVIGIGDSGINPYHEEFSAESYPDPEVLRITNNFTRHPSEYIAGYPKDTPAIPITLGKGYLPKEDKDLWTRATIAFQKQYWIPGTKIIGAIDWTDSSGTNAAADSRPILDDDGHGTETSSVSTGNRFGNCPACLLMFAEGLSGDDYIVGLNWVDILSMSVGSVGNVGFGLDTADSAGVIANRKAAERGMTQLYAAGNGYGNAFDVPMTTWTSTNAGPDWHVIVGAARTDNKRPIVGDANPVDISSWGDGTIPSACVSGTTSMCNFGGTSAATPLTAGVFGQVLREVRRAVGDTFAGARPGQTVAKGKSVPASEFLRDGVLTRAELWNIVFHSADAFGAEGVPVPPYTHTWPGPASTDYLFGGYGLATPESALRAIDVALGRAPLASRPSEDSFFATDAAVRDALWGTWDSGSTSSSSSSATPSLLGGIQMGQVLTLADALNTLQTLQAAAVQAAATAGGGVTYYLHHSGGCPLVAAPAGGVEAGGNGTAASGFTFMDRSDKAGDDEPCPNARATTVLAYFRPVGVWSSGEPVGSFLPAGSAVDATIYLTMDHPMLLEATGFLLAGKRAVGQGASAPTPVVDVLAAKCKADKSTCWTEVPIRFTTTRPVGAHEVLTYQVALRSSENTFFGYESGHASKVTVTPASGSGSPDLIAAITSLADGATVSSGELTIKGTAHFADQQTESLRRVELSLDDPSFTDPIPATSEKNFTSWSAKVPIASGQHRIYARAVQDRLASSPDSVRLFRPGVLGGTVGRSGPLPATGVNDSPFGLVLLALSALAALGLRKHSGRDATPPPGALTKH